ncbi:MAG TPA: wax ester/triacylglycerol synthase family O-acyltransferase [Nevskiaceae bacterium]|nr:wax ester/triacylglycerol synthase family O-acyltransferase [Nevskiaceae bacterium]
MTKRLKPMDAAWLYVDTKETPMHVGCMAIFSLPDDAPADFLVPLFAHLRASQDFSPPFNLKLKNPRARLAPAWVEAERIDLDYHLRHSALPAPGGERELGVLISRLHSHPMDFKRPLWETHVIEGLRGPRGEARFALYMKMHHSLVDGVGGMRMLARMLSPDPAIANLPPPWTVGAGGARERKPAVGSQWQRFAEAARGQLKTLPLVSRALTRVVRESFKKTDPAEALPFSGPKSILNGPVSGQRRFATQHYELARIKRVAQAAGVTVNDVFLGLSAAALRRYLLEIGALPAQPLTAGVPVSVRPAGDENVGNAISFIIANLNTQLADPLQRLQAIRASTQIAKQHLQALPAEALSPYTLLFMAPFILQLLAGRGGRGKPMFNVTISNVPGLDRVHYFNGARLEQIYPVSLLSHGQALNITVVSYAGQFNIGFTGCRDTLPSMQKLAVYTGEALEELERLLPAARAPGRKRSSEAA